MKPHSAAMEKRQCSLRFDEHPNNFVRLLEDFRAKELYCDATIACDGKKYPVHQVVLSTSSEFFADIFASTNCHNPVIVLQDVSRFHLESLLTYIYRGEVFIPQHEMPTFLSVAKSLFIKGLTIPRVTEEDESENVNSMLIESDYDLQQNASVMYPLSEFHQGSPKLPRFRHLQEENGSQSFQTESYHVRKIHNHGKQALNPLKRSYDSEHPQDLSISSFPKCRASSLGEHYNRHSHNRYKESEEQEGTDRRVDSVSQENNKDGDDKKSDLSDHSQITSQTGTFQDLIAADETPIKEEPQDIEYEYDVKSANLFQDVNCVPHENNDFEKPNLKIYNGNARECDSPKRKVVSPMDQREGVVLSLSASDRYPSHHASHLKKELLRPTSQVVIEHSHQTNDDIIPQSIPHPVIALRESLPQVSSSRSHIHSPPTRRDPPPLVKLLPKLSELMGGEDDSIEEQRIQRSQSGIRRNSNSHLLVSAPPTYHSHFNKPQNPHHFTLEIHNQQLGQVFVNGGSHLDVKNPYIIAKSQAMKSKKSINLVNHISNDGPLNLSGHNRKSPIALLTDDVNAGDDPFLGKILTNRKKRLRGPKSWEFLVRLLKDPTTNPTLIRWENKDSGVFRLVQPSVIAQRWGRRTGKHASENLTYENFARGLRYHYATGALKPVSEKSFVYRLGPKALKLLEDYDSSPVPFL